MPSVSSLFLCCFCCRKLLRKIFSDLDENLRGFFIEQMKTGARRTALGGPHRPGRPLATTLLGPVAGTRPCLVGHRSAASDAYKIIPDGKTLTPEGFFQIRYRGTPPSPTSFGGQIVPVPALCRDGDWPPEPSSPPSLPPG